MRRALLFGVICVLNLASAMAASRPMRWSVTQSKEEITVRNPAGAEVLTYQLVPPKGTNTAIQSGCFFHPVKTPAGKVVTDVGPSDHPHHRGIFLAWVEMHGKADADFWGWGEHAPTKNRRIVNRKVSDLARTELGAGFHVVNDWMAEKTKVLTEDLKASIHRFEQAHVLDLVYTLKAEDDLKLSRWAFSGFCARLPKDGKISASGPDGPVALPNPKHTEPASDWPAAAWYNYDLETAAGVSGVAVIDHPKNPPSLWHNHRDIRMLNPCIVAPGEVLLKSGKPLVLRYRLIIHDGPVSPSELNRQAKDWAR